MIRFTMWFWLVWLTALVLGEALVIPAPVITGGDLPAPIKVISSEQARDKLGEWRERAAPVCGMMSQTKSQYRLEEPTVLFLAFCPRAQDTIDYIFQVEIEIIEMTYSVLHVISGAASPLSDSNVGSADFRECLRQCAVADEINFEPLMRIKQFQLSWALADSKEI